MNKEELEKKIREITAEKTGTEPVLRRLRAGNSTAVNYRAESPAGEWFIKAYESGRESRLKLLETIFRAGVPIAEPLFDEAISPTVRVLGLRWLELRPVKPDGETAALAAEVLRKLHSVPVPEGTPVYPLWGEFRSYQAKAEYYGVDFPEKKAVYAFLEERIPALSFQPSIVHMDFHTGNLMLGKNGLVLTDFENLSVTDSRRDLVYAAFFHKTAENGFWRRFISEYCRGTIPGDFWDTMKTYCYLQLLRMMICEAQKGNKDMVTWLADSIRNSFGPEEKMPGWAREQSAGLFFRREKPQG